MLRTSVATLTSKGQLTIPKAIRDALGLHAGDQVRFEFDEVRGVARLESVKFRPEDLASFALPGMPRMGFEEMDAAKQAGATR